jgi:hypothetical protein
VTNQVAEFPRTLSVVHVRPTRPVTSETSTPILLRILVAAALLAEVTLLQHKSPVSRRVAGTAVTAEAMERATKALKCILRKKIIIVGGRVMERLHDMLTCLYRLSDGTYDELC